jgi:Zonular occludens toxin (Zot)
MPCFAFTGKTGQGKGLCSAAFVGEYLQRGKLVATNMDIYPENFKDKQNRNIRLIRLPDIPTAADLEALGLGNECPEDEDENGLIMLDEVGVILNSRKWNVKGREELVSYIRHRRKYGFDMGFQIQGMGSLDSQVREDIIDYEVRCTKIQSLKIPVISFFIKLATGKTFNKLPKFMRWHTARFRNTETDMIDEVHRYTGGSVHNIYDTKQVITDDYPHGSYSVLTPWHLVGRYQKKTPILKTIGTIAALSVLYVASVFDNRSKEFLQARGLP